jgi:hypothetical protein
MPELSPETVLTIMFVLSVFSGAALATFLFDLLREGRR